MTLLATTTTGPILSPTCMRARLHSGARCFVFRNAPSSMPAVRQDALGVVSLSPMPGRLPASPPRRCGTAVRASPSISDGPSPVRRSLPLPHALTINIWAQRWPKLAAGSPNQPNPLVPSHVTELRGPKRGWQNCVTYDRGMRAASADLLTSSASAELIDCAAGLVGLVQAERLGCGTCKANPNLVRSRVA
jgi:hypothetical protein